MLTVHQHLLAMTSLQTLFQVPGKTALVTGCDRGIGQSIAVGLAEAGVHIIGVSRHLSDDGETAKKVRETGQTFKAYAADISNRDSLYEFIIQVKKENSPVDILINNAGIIMRKPAADHPDEYWDTVLSVNLDAPFILTREFGKDMIAKGSGKIVFTCSMLSYQGGINVPGYTASKSAVAGLVKAFANEWAGKGVNVNGIAPGYIDTSNTKALREDEARNKAILERIPAGRWGTPDDCKGAVVFLCSGAAAYIHGTILNVDGGWQAR